jgi:HK97 family phage major capsid protein
MDIKALREEFATTHTQAQALISKAAEAKRKLTAEEQANNDARFARCDLIREQLEANAKFAKLALDAGSITLPAAPAGREEYEANEGNKNFVNADGVLNVVAVRKGINNFARTGDSRQLFTITSGTTSGAYLPKEVLQPISIRRLQNVWRGVLAAYDMSAMEIDTVATFSLPVADDSSNVGQNVSESATSGTSLDPSQSAITIAPTLWDSKAYWYSQTMVMASSFDVVGFTLPMAQKRIDKFQESQWTTNVITNGNVGLTTASATAITYAELLTWEHSLAPAYRPDAAFALADSLYKALRGLVDNNNRPVLDLDPTNTFVGKIHGKPVVVGDYFQTLAANHITGAFVSASAIKIVDVKDARLARYSNLPSNPDQVGFQMFVNGDFGFVTNGISLVKTAIS